jgi:hypothetical protein
MEWHFLLSVLDIYYRYEFIFSAYDDSNKTTLFIDF